MAQGIQDIANGQGLLYVVSADGSTILATQENNAEGARLIRQIGAQCAPISTDRSSVGIVTFTATPAGNVTGITVNGVNQLGGNVAATAGDPTATAASVAAAISAFTPASGPDYTAQSIGAAVLIFSPPINGVAVNGSTITVATSTVNITSTTTDFTGGANGSGAFDSVVGLQFFLNANYGGAAPADSISAAIDITPNMVVRGMQSGTPLVSARISTDAIRTLARYSTIQEILVGTAASAPTDLLAYINPAEFAPGDTIRLRAAELTEVTTVIDASDTASPLLQRNIYLCNQTPFVLTNNRSISLTLVYDDTLGPIWQEDFRATSGGVITTTVAGIQALGGAGDLNTDALYFVSDMGNGTYARARTPYMLDSTGTHMRRVPYNYTGCWQANMSAPVVGQYYRYYQTVYVSVTGAVGTAPSGDTTNWLAIAVTDDSYYESQSNAAGLNDIGLIAAWPFIWEKDCHNNYISQSYRHRNTSGQNAFNLFAWRQASLNTSAGNTVIDGLLDCANSNGVVANNFISSYGSVMGNTLPTGSVLSNNIVENSGAMSANYVATLTGNRIFGGAISNNGDATLQFAQIAYNQVSGGSITGNTVTGATGHSIEYSSVDYAGGITDNVFGIGAKIRYTKVGTACAIDSCALLAPTSLSNIESVVLSGLSTLTTITHADQISYTRFENTTATLTDPNMDACVFEDSTITATCASAWLKMQIRNSSLTWTAAVGTNSQLFNVSGTFSGTISNSSISNRTASGSPAFSISDAIITDRTSSATVELDLSDAAIFSGGELTLASALQWHGIFTMIGGPVTIDEIVNPSTAPKMFRPNDVAVYTFDATGKATVAGNQIAGNAAAYAIAAVATGATDQIIIEKINDINTVTSANILV